MVILLSQRVPHFQRGGCVEQLSRGNSRDLLAVGQNVIHQVGVTNPLLFLKGDLEGPLLPSLRTGHSVVTSLCGSLFLWSCRISESD